MGASCRTGPGPGKAALTAIQAAGFAEQIGDEQVSGPVVGPAVAAGGSGVTIRRLVKGDHPEAVFAAGARNEQKGRIARIQAIFVRR